MEQENESYSTQETNNLQTLQAVLFPPQSTNSTSFFSNFLIKQDLGENDDEDKFKIKESSSKDFLTSKENLQFTVQPARWPTECQVLDERIQHISYIPPNPEPYYQVTCNEAQPKPIGDEVGLIVFQYNPISAVNYFSRSSIGGSKYLTSAHLCPEEDCLKFESRFECGNLARAIKITPNYYELHIRSDLYTNRHMQWFYFKVCNTRKRFLYRFSIVNFTKETSLYNEGMKPLIYSTKDSQLHSIGWRRCGENITYYCNDNVSPEDPDQAMTYTLSFTVEFPHDNDEVYLAHCYPYTYSDLQDYLLELSTHPVKSTFTSVRLLCKTLAGNNVHYVTITSPQNSGDNKRKRAVVLSARVHPGETPSSWIMKGILDFLTSDSGTAKELRDKFIFKIVPMLNPDGVIIGNNRCSLSAKDLNRQYRTVIRDAYPSIWYTKLMVRRLLEDCGVAMYCDLHAHSRKHNIFIYGCENRRGAERRLQEQVFPLMLHKNSADKFSFESCTFRIQKAKEGTGRVVMWMMGIANSYTMEASFAGSMLGNRAETHFSTFDYEQMGKTFCQTLLDFYDDDPRKEKLRQKIIERLFLEGSNADEPTNIRLSDYSSDEGDISSSSSNEAGHDEDIYLTVPPPSPATGSAKRNNKPKPHSSPLQTKPKSATRSPNIQRKTLPLCKTILGLSLSEKEYSSDSESEMEYEKNKREKRIVKRKKKKKKSFKKKSQKNVKKRKRTFKRKVKGSIIKHGKSKTLERKIRKLKKRKIKIKTKRQEYSDSETTKRNTSISVFDLIPNEKMTPYVPKFKRSKTPPPQATSEKKNSISQQLAEVQARLISLKNKIWFGMGNGEEPISWGRGGNIFLPDIPKKNAKKVQKKKNDKRLKLDKKNEDLKDQNYKTESKDKSNTKKNQNGFRRQTAIEIPNPPIKLRKSKSLPSTSKLLPLSKEKAAVLSCDEDKKEKNDKKKKKKQRKFAKKAKCISNAKTFIKD